MKVRGGTDEVLILKQENFTSGNSWEGRGSEGLRPADT